MSTEDLLYNEYRNRLVDLEKVGLSLKDEMYNLSHELRRVRDGIEREAGAGHGLEQRVVQLGDNIKLCENDLKLNLIQQANVSKQLEERPEVKNKGE